MQVPTWQFHGGGRGQAPSDLRSRSVPYPASTPDSVIHGASLIGDHAQPGALAVTTIAPNLAVAGTATGPGDPTMLHHSPNGTTRIA